MLSLGDSVPDPLLLASLHFFFNDTATTEIYTLSLHDALPICEHLYEMDYLRAGIHLRAMANRDPVVEYQREGFDMFSQMLDGIKEESVGFLFNLEVKTKIGRAHV